MTLLVLSPHMDDAALCAAGHIQLARNNNVRVVIVSVFAGFPPSGKLSALARDFHTDCGLSSDAVTVRRAEDAAAAAILDAEIVWLDFPDAIYRVSSGVHAYASREALFGCPVDDGAICAEAVRQIGCSFPDVDELLIPLGVGGHVDHKLTRRIGEILLCSIGPRLVAWYEESLYVWQLGADAWRGVDTKGIVCRDVVLSSAFWDCKCAAVESYRSQISMLGLDLHDPNSIMNSSLRTERIWLSSVGGQATASIRHADYP